MHDNLQLYRFPTRRIQSRSTQRWWHMTQYRFWAWAIYIIMSAISTQLNMHQLPWSTSDHIAHYVCQRHIKDNQKVHPWRVQSYQPCLPPMQIGSANIQHGDQSYYYRVGSIHNEREYIIVSPFLPFFGFARIHLWSSIENNDKHNQAGGKYHIHSKVLQCPCYHIYPSISILAISVLNVNLRLTTGTGASCDGGAVVSGASRRVQCLLFSNPIHFTLCLHLINTILSHDRVASESCQW